jgi:hypothetical protein
MKTRIILIAFLFTVVTAFQKPTQTAKVQEVSKNTKQQVSKKLAWVRYCGYLSASCNGPLEIVIDSDGTTAYVVSVSTGGVPVSFSVVSVAPAGSSGVYSININYMCNGTWTNYVGGAYVSPC